MTLNLQIIRLKQSVNTNEIIMVGNRPGVYTNLEKVLTHGSSWQIFANVPVHFNARLWIKEIGQRNSQA